MPIIHFSPGTNNGGGSLRRTSTTTVPLFLFHAITVISTTTVFTTTISNVNINSASINSSFIEGGAHSLHWKNTFNIYRTGRNFFMKLWQC